MQAPIHFDVSTMGGNSHNLIVSRGQVCLVSELRGHVANSLGCDPAQVQLVFGTRQLLGDVLIDESIDDIIGPAASAQITAIVTMTHVPMEDLLNKSDVPVLEYMPRIFQKMREAEMEYLVDAGYMNAQPHIDATIRMHLVELLVHMHGHLNFQSKTLFSTVNLLDRYLQQRQVSSQLLRLVGVTCLAIAAKVEEVSTPLLSDYLTAFPNTYTIEEISALEVQVITTLDFKVNAPTATEFLIFFEMANAQSSEQYQLSMAQYILELSLGCLQLVCARPSCVAAASVMLSNMLLQKSSAWPPAMVRYTGYQGEDLEPCVMTLRNLIGWAGCGAFPAVRRKFAAVAPIVESMLQ